MNAEYTIEEHIHRVAAWAASRAASVKGQRFTVATGMAALEAIEFSRDLNIDDLPDADDIDRKHADWRNGVIAALDRTKVSHGVAAKLINCYLKLRFVCAGHHQDPRVMALHPPIDRILLTKLSRRTEGNLADFWRKKRDRGWSNFSSEEYEAAVGKIREVLTGAPMWKIEENWTPNQ